MTFSSPPPSPKSHAKAPHANKKHDGGVNNPSSSALSSFDFIRGILHHQRMRRFCVRFCPLFPSSLFLVVVVKSCLRLVLWSEKNNLTHRGRIPRQTLVVDEKWERRLIGFSRTTLDVATKWEKKRSDERSTRKNEFYISSITIRRKTTNKKEEKIQEKKKEKQKRHVSLCSTNATICGARHGKLVLRGVCKSHNPNYPKYRLHYFTECCISITTLIYTLF